MERNMAVVGALAPIAVAAYGASTLSSAPVQKAPLLGAPSATDAARFLIQATYGPSSASIAELQALGYQAWIDQQIAMPVSESHLEGLDRRLSTLRVNNPRAVPNLNDFSWTYWRQAIAGVDQLRQRVKFALSEIFVISLVDSKVDARGAASYFDVLGEHAFGNFRTLLESVTLHPMMGLYLTWIGNQKEDAETGRHPDENYAREIMQLMTIGLVELNLDGTPRLDAAGRQIATYSADDVQGLAKVFTGYSWASDKPTESTFRFGFLGVDAGIRPMMAYPAFHSTSSKSFLGATIPASKKPDPAGDLKIALDTLFHHPNVGPFIGRQLIQRLVTSNPSPAYVARVAAAFNNNGAGVRGDLGAVVRAILLDSEARDIGRLSDPNFGKLREPVVRLANWARAFGATSQTGDWMIPSTSATTNNYGQLALAAPSVFNFFRPGYSPPNSRLGTQNLVAPEFQIVDEISVAGYANAVQTTIDAGIGVTPTGGAGPDVRPNYDAELAVASNVNALVNRIDLLLLNGQMSANLRTRTLAALETIDVSGDAASVQKGLLNRVKLTIYMAMVSPEYIAQR